MPSCSAIDLAEIRRSCKIPFYDIGELGRAKDLSAPPRNRYVKIEVSATGQEALSSAPKSYTTASEILSKPRRTDV
jgi:hypothetical protein